MDYKYITRFDADAKEIDSTPIVSGELAGLASLKKEAKASLDELVGLMPKNLNPKDNADLLYMASPLVLVGKCNLNGDCLDKQGAIAYYKTFAKKFLDVEHNREKIIGNIFASALTEIDTNRILTEEEALNKEFFNISYASYIWKILNPKLAEFVSMASKETSPYYNTVSSSFEVGFDEYKIAVGSLILSQARILTSEEQPAYEKYLKANDGKGVDEQGNPVYRVLAYDWAGRGAGLVSRPASQVKGVLTIESMIDNAPELKDEGDDKSAEYTVAQLVKDMKKKDEEFAITIADLKKAIESIKNNTPEKDAKASESNNLEKKNIQIKNDGVITNTAKPMKITKLEDIAANKAELFKNEAYATDIAQLIADETAKISEKYVQQLKDKEDAAKFLAEAKASAEAKAKELETKAKELEAKVQELATQLNKIEEAKANEIAEKLFNERMAGLDAEFELDDESRGFVAVDIKGMTEDAFAAYAKKAKALFKKKGAKPSDDEDAKKAKAALDAKAAVAGAVDEKQAGIPSAPPATPTLAERMNKAFSAENIKIDGKEIKGKQE